MMEESRVSLYTGDEPGIGLFLAESITAGCIPIAPFTSGNGQMLMHLRIGFFPNDIRDIPTCIRKAMDSDLLPEQIAVNSSQFLPEKFRELIKEKLAEIG